MIAAKQLGFSGEVVHGPHDAPACCMDCCYHKHKHGRPYLHNKDIIVQNLSLLFARIPKVVIDDYGSVKDWFKEASHKTYWTALMRCRLEKQAILPAIPTEWPLPRQQSPQGHPSSSVPQIDADPTNNNDTDPLPISTPPHQHPPTPTPRQSQPRIDYDPAMVGRSLEHSFKALGLGLGATETMCTCANLPS